jgi:hypothetical protein
MDCPNCNEFYTKGLQFKEALDKKKRICIDHDRQLKDLTETVNRLTQENAMYKKQLDQVSTRNAARDQKLMEQDVLISELQDENEQLKTARLATLNQSETRSKVDIIEAAICPWGFDCHHEKCNLMFHSKNARNVSLPRADAVKASVDAERLLLGCVKRLSNTKDPLKTDQEPIGTGRSKHPTPRQDQESPKGSPKKRPSNDTGDSRTSPARNRQNNSFHGPPPGFEMVPGAHVPKRGAKQQLFPTDSFDDFNFIES